MLAPLNNLVTYFFLEISILHLQRLGQLVQLSPAKIISYLLPSCPCRSRNRSLGGHKNCHTTLQKCRGCAIGSWGGYGGSQHASSTNFATPVTSPPRLCINVRVLRGLKNQVSGILFFSISPPPPPSSLSSSSSS